MLTYYLWSLVSNHKGRQLVLVHILWCKFNKNYRLITKNFIVFFAQI